MSTAPVFVQNVGMACPLGLTARSACAAIRAGLDRKQETRYVDDEGSPIIGSYLDEFESGMDRKQRWLGLLAFAVEDLVANVSGDGIHDLPIICVVPESGKEPTDNGEVAALLSTLGIGIDPTKVSVMPGGSSSVFEAIKSALSMLLETQHSKALVCAADSLINAPALLHLSSHSRLRTEANSDGVTPGEAAAALLISLDSRQARGAIRGLGFGLERSLLSNDIPLRGEGIVQAARGALAESELAMHEIDFRLSDAAGESFYFKEQVLAVTRLLRQNKAEFPLWLTALSLGDVGASAGLTSIVNALIAIQLGYAPGGRAIVYAGHENGERAAAVITDC